MADMGGMFKGDFDPYSGDIYGATTKTAPDSSATKTSADPLKFLYAAEGGSIEDLLAYLRR
jgi:hypothetical protein